MTKMLIKCAECNRESQLDLPFKALSNAQKAAISKGESFSITADNLDGFELDEEEKVALKENGSATVFEDFSYVCDACGSESNWDDDGNRIQD